MNIYYIRAAIEAATGIKLTVDEVKEYLVSEGMATEDRINRSIFNGYDAMYGKVSVKERPAKVFFVGRGR